MSAIRDIPLKTIRGGQTSLGDHAGTVLLIVNTASKCGLTPQYAALEATHEKYRDLGFSVLGFPANDFGAQEPGTDEEIAEFCLANFDIAFPMFAKIVATGADKHPLYAALTAARPEATAHDSAFRDKLERYGIPPKGPGEVLWNFEKFLVGRDGEVVGRFSPEMTPDDPVIVAAIEAELAKPL
ncbi:glutathione peroxidase [Sphingomonas solaris]|uniref:Glutathione peroxidase n=1 Tax=Alterirhizorhabdus solaris TaxID=2529389 RepID=A0A558R7Y6_9SPHN|nr:glutathione peroxidase [Sphingomonas solaris]TVV75490.1 glutathione peroxidase [Sphingomonas solaris]